MSKKLNPENASFNVTALSAFTEAAFKKWFESIYDGDAKEWHAKIKKMK